MSLNLQRVERISDILFVIRSYSLMFIKWTTEAFSRKQTQRMWCDYQWAWNTYFTIMSRFVTRFHFAEIVMREWWQKRMMSDHHYHDDSDDDEWAWGVEWIWVGGYSAAATTIILLNFMLFISIIRNRYLHYSFNYVVFILSFRYPPDQNSSKSSSVNPRNICRVIFTLFLVFLAKLSQSKLPESVKIPLKTSKIYQLCSM